MPVATEQANRSKGVNFIAQVGILLKLPQLTLATASVYLHRFFMRYSMVDLPNRPGMHYYAVAATSLFLATKVEENCRKMKELVIACCRVAQKQPALVVDEQSKEYWRWRDTILHNEDLLLEALCFDLQLEQPYRLLFDFLCYFEVQDNKRLRNAAWAFVNDSNLTVLCLLFTPRTIAASALYAAAKHTSVAFQDDVLGRPWWEVLDVDLGQIRKACNRMAEVYENSTLPRQGAAYTTTPEDGDEASAKTRLKNESNGVSGSEVGTTPLSAEGEDRERKRSRDEIDDELRLSDNTQNNSNNIGTENGTVSPPPTTTSATTDSQPRSQSQDQLQAPPKPQSQSQQDEPEPKRPRLSPPSQSQSTNTLRRTTSHEDAIAIDRSDDVQQRIDDIISGSAAKTTDRPPLARRESSRQQQQQQQRQEQSWTRSTSSSSGGRSEQRWQQPDQQRRGSWDRHRDNQNHSQSQRRGSWDRDRDRDRDQHQSQSQRRGSWNRDREGDHQGRQGPSPPPPPPPPPPDDRRPSRRGSRENGSSRGGSRDDDEKGVVSAPAHAPTGEVEAPARSSRQGVEDDGGSEEGEV